ncbi:hypothetical protein GGI03_006405 [Coemansia sp. RSA 2337]|nr:hypothetical protein GGF41_002610 [Coemansia sp. RSA 2531]KAJ2456394.1 hypothetical protein GGI03_006405 [Coemansia sp. RSA 2337]
MYCIETSVDPTASTASVAPAQAKQVEQYQFETCQKSSVTSPALRRAVSAAGDAVSVLSTSNPSTPVAQNGGGSSNQRLMRGKRSLDPFDLMDIEPPRRRQRKEDIEMA